MLIKYLKLTSRIFWYFLSALTEQLNLLEFKRNNLNLSKDTAGHKMSRMLMDIMSPNIAVSEKNLSEFKTMKYDDENGLQHRYYL